MANADLHAGPKDVYVTITFTYNETKYSLGFEVDRPTNTGPDVICFSRKIADKIKEDVLNNKKHEPTKMVAPDKNPTLPSYAHLKTISGSGAALGATALPESGVPPFEHTPICWHDPSCEFWCVE